MPNVLFRCDGGPRIGTGHLVRCQALGKEMQGQGWCVAFAVSSDVSAELLSFATVNVPDGLEGASATAARVMATEVDCLVVDHYGLDRAFETIAGAGRARVVAIDDFADRAHACDLLVNPTTPLPKSAYVHLTPAGTPLLLGPAYALLRTEYLDGRLKRLSRPHNAPMHVVVMLGGADPDNVSSFLLQGLQKLRRAGFVCTLVIGPANRHANEIARQSESAGVAAVVNPPHLVDLMASADIGVTAGGTTALEFSCLGVPTLVLVTAANQSGVAQALCEAGASLMLDHDEVRDPHRLASAVASLAKASDVRDRMTIAGRQLVDGQGAARVCRAITNITASKSLENIP